MHTAQVDIEGLEAEEVLVFHLQLDSNIHCLQQFSEARKSDQRFMNLYRITNRQID